MTHDTIHITLPDDLTRLLEREAARRHTSMERLAATLVTHALDHDHDHE